MQLDFEIPIKQCRQGTGACAEIQKYSLSESFDDIHRRSDGRQHVDKYYFQLFFIGGNLTTNSFSVTAQRYAADYLRSPIA
jgi:hypothetical protein